ncbi:MAG: hypothetical protein IRZ00_10355 [Gemmatimonadetes bacterium]|nr:hypothetical protein [Gemmatimonadota bacterium]
MRHRAALATLTVDNRTDRRLQIAFRPAASPGGAVVVGEVDPAATATMAPIPAGEPLILVAVDPEGRRFDLAPRSFDLDATWTWVIPADAAFQPNSGERSP